MNIARVENIHRRFGHVIRLRTLLDSQERRILCVLVSGVVFQGNPINIHVPWQYIPRIQIAHTLGLKKHSNEFDNDRRLKIPCLHCLTVSHEVYRYWWS